VELTRCRCLQVVTRDACTTTRSGDGSLAAAWGNFRWWNLTRLSPVGRHVVTVLGDLSTLTRRLSWQRTVLLFGSTSMVAGTSRWVRSGVEQRAIVAHYL
jgi:hypothetical protein